MFLECSTVGNLLGWDTKAWYVEILINPKMIINDYWSLVEYGAASEEKDQTHLFKMWQSL